MDPNSIFRRVPGIRELSGFQPMCLKFAGFKRIAAGPAVSDGAKHVCRTEVQVTNERNPS